MKYVGIQTAIWKNKSKTVLLSLLFPFFFLLVYVLVFAFDAGFHIHSPYFWDYVYTNSGNALIISLPFLLIWFFIAFSFHKQLIFKFSGAKELQRKDAPQLYNIVENLCISR
ncbi:MAG: hypothetical protein GXP45_04585 [bacterium]|nr:hypothetical protein [bacterium]